MRKWEQQEAYVRRHAARIASFAEAMQESCGRGVILIGWSGPVFDQESPALAESPELTELPELFDDQLVYLNEENVKQCLAQIVTRQEENLADRIINAIKQYDPTWEAVIVFLDETEKVADLHVAGFIPERPAEHLFPYSMPNATNH